MTVRVSAAGSPCATVMLSGRAPGPSTSYDSGSGSAWMGGGGTLSKGSTKALERGMPYVSSGSIDL